MYTKKFEFEIEISFNVNLLSAKVTLHLISALAPAMAVKSSTATGNDPVSPPKIYRKCNRLVLVLKKNHFKMFSPCRYPNPNRRSKKKAVPLDVSDKAL